MAGSAALHVFVVAGEESGDRLGAALMQALRERTGGGVRFSGVGGVHMAARGLSSLVPINELAGMGFVEIPARLLRLLRHIRNIAKAVVAVRPDVLVIIDSPDFTHRVAKRVRKTAPEIPIVDYVSPSVWAWRPGRARAMRGYVDHVMALLPFEPAVHGRLGGPPCSYVGHPLSERVGALRPSVREQKRRESSPPVLLVMPGSRKIELHRLLGLFERTVELIARQIDPLEIIVPMVPTLAPMVEQAVAAWTVPAKVVSDPAEKDATFRIARAALVKSGTGTLELAVAGVPMAVAYRGSAIEAFVVRRLVTVSTVVLANLVSGTTVVPEFLQENATPEKLAEAMIPLLRESLQRDTQIETFKSLDTIMEIGAAKPSDRAAAIVLDAARKR